MIVQLNLVRQAYMDRGTFGRLYGDEIDFATVERPWLQNVPFRSCIPEGVYQLNFGRFNRGGYDAWELVDVPGRSLIKIHRANLPRELHGCIGIGADHGCVNGDWGVVQSRSAYRSFMDATSRYKHDTVFLRITQIGPGGVPA